MRKWLCMHDLQSWEYVLGNSPGFEFWDLPRKCQNLFFFKITSFDAPLVKRYMYHFWANRENQQILQLVYTVRSQSFQKLKYAWLTFGFGNSSTAFNSLWHSQLLMFMLVMIFFIEFFWQFSLSLQPYFSTTARPSNFSKTYTDVCGRRLIFFGESVIRCISSTRSEQTGASICHCSMSDLAAII